MRQTKLKRLQWWGFIVLFVYWSSLLWLEHLFVFLGHSVGDSVAKILEIYYAPAHGITVLLAGAMPHPYFMFYGPLVAILAGFLGSTFLWAVIVAVSCRRSAS